jgi:hypothetical protein
MSYKLYSRRCHENINNLIADNTTKTFLDFQFESYLKISLNNKIQC